MRVLLFIDSLVIGGAQRQFLNLACGLQRNNCDVRICTYYPLDGLVRNSPIDIPIECFEKSSKFDLSPIFKLKGAINNFQPDVLVSFLSTACVYAELSRCTGHSVPIVVSERTGASPNKFRLMGYLAAPLHLLATTVVFNNQAYRELMGRRFPLIKNRSKVIYNGIDPKFFLACDNLKEGETRQVADSKREQRFRFCCVSARPTEEKGLFDLIRAAAILNRQAPGSFGIDWIGPNDIHLGQVKRARDLIDSLGLAESWRWLGARSDMEKLYIQYDALLIPSHREGLSNALCEAMACGLPCIATDIADHRLIFEQSRAGLLCEPSDEISLSNAMHKMMQLDPTDRSNYSQRAQAFALENFGIEKTIENWLHTIEEAANRCIAIEH